MTVTVQDVSSREVKTKFGLKKTYSFKADNEWYSTGFKTPGVSVGDVVQFDCKDTQYGKEVVGSIKVGTAAPTPLAGTPAPAPTPLKSFDGGNKGGGKGVFPIPALDGQRAIVRQNAITNARELVVASYGGKPITGLVYNELATTIITVAKRFEAYACGDDDLNEVKAEVAAEKKAA